jgi:uncharacterized protein YdiU (UPF0061 family)
MQLAGALRQIAEAEPLIAALDRFAEHYQPAIADAVLWRLGRVPRAAEEDRALVQAVERALRTTTTAIDRVFFDGFAQPLPHTYDTPWDEVRGRLAPYAMRRGRDHAYWQGAPCAMTIEEVEAIWAPIAADDDWTRFYATIANIRAMGEALA